MTKFMNNAMKSSKTTVAGVLAAALVIGQQILNGIDGIDETTMSWNVIAAQIAILYGFIMARDNDKSSDQVGVK